MKNIVLDLGNTNAKLFLFDDDLCLERLIIDKLTSSSLFNTISTYNDVDYVILIAVIDVPLDILNILRNHSKLFIVSPEVQLPFYNRYKTLLTLGADRLALVAAAVEYYPHQNILIIDVGSCITYDILTRHRVYMGGAISPGFSMRLESLSHFIKKLPKVLPSIPKDITGNSTSDCMLSGSYFGIIDEIEGFVERYKRLYENLTIIITGGGNVKSFAKQLKSSIFAEPDFLPKGGLSLLKFNEN